MLGMLPVTSRRNVPPYFGFAAAGAGVAAAVGAATAVAGAGTAVLPVPAVLAPLQPASEVRQVVAPRNAAPCAKVRRRTGRRHRGVIRLRSIFASPSLWPSLPFAERRPGSHSRAPPEASGRPGGPIRAIIAIWDSACNIPR